MNKMCEPTTIKTKSLENYQTLKAHDMEHKRVPSKEAVLYGKDHIVEVTLKEKVKSQKHTSAVANFSPGQKTEKKMPISKDNKTPKNWGNVFRKQNLEYIAKEKSPQCNEKAKKNINSKKQRNSPVRHSMKSGQKHLTSIPCSCSSILVRDSAVQCSETYNFNKFAEFNPIHMLYLIKQLKDLVNKKDKRTCEIFTEMEQILQKIPAQETEVESNAIPLEEPNKKKAMPYESFILQEQEKLKSEILKRDERLKEVDKKYSELAFHAKTLAQQLQEVTQKKNDTISVLRQENESNENKIIDLKAVLKEQTELAQKNFIDNKYLTMEIDKLITLSSYKDAQIINYQNTIKGLQNQITRQLKTINEIRKEGSTSPQTSLIHTGHACSSPTSSFSEDSDKSWRDLSNISSVDFVHEENIILKENAPVKDFEFVSLLDGESSHSVLTDQNEVTKDKGGIVMQNNTVPYQSVNTKNVMAKKSFHHSKNNHNKENDIYKTRKLTRLKEKQNDNTKNLFLNASKVPENITSTKSIVSDIKKQGDTQNRKPVSVPSPLREYPHPPDWSDSSLPSISTVSNLVPSNDV